MGNLKGTLTVNNKKHLLDMWAFRDHSFGEPLIKQFTHNFKFYLSIQDIKEIGVSYIVMHFIWPI